MYKKFSGRNSNRLYFRMLNHLIKNGEQVAPRGKATLEIQTVTTILQPRERVLTVPGRANNPFFNVAENLAIIGAIKNQREWLGFFNKNYLQFFDDDSSPATWAFYGDRLRRYPAAEIKEHQHGNVKRYDPEFYVYDQLQAITRKLQEDPFSRQAVAALWHPVLDNQSGHKDYPCNFAVEFKIRNGRLNMTVVNRSNDIHWGLFGVNLSQWSFIQEVMAAIIGVGIGEQTHLSDSLHLYLQEPHNTITENMINHKVMFDVYEYVEAMPMFSGPVTWEDIDFSLGVFFDNWSHSIGGNPTWPGVLRNWPFLDDAWNFLMAYKHRKNPEAAFGFMTDVRENSLWVAGVEFLLRTTKNNEGWVGPLALEAALRFREKSAAIMAYITTANLGNRVPETTKVTT